MIWRRPWGSILLLVASIFWGTACHPRVPLFQPGAEPELHFAPTEDGWKLALYHYPARHSSPEEIGRGPEIVSRAPLLLVHGLACNHRTFDLTESLSLSRFFAAHGYDVWTLELRGHGASQWPPGRKKDSANWGISEHALLDAPAAIRYVREKTGAPEVDWLGHSMGGMIIYMYLANSGATDVRNVVTIGSPGSVDFPNDIVAFALENARAFTWMRRIHVKALAGAWSRIGGRLPGGFDEAIWHLDNIPPDTTRLVFYLGLEDIERGVQNALLTIGSSRRLMSRDQQIDFNAKLARFSNPLLAVAGRLDGIAPPHTVLQVFNAVGSTDKTYELMGRANGCSVDYGHVDMVLGTHAREDIFPRVLQWLETHQFPPSSLHQVTPPPLPVLSPTDAPPSAFAQPKSY